METFKLTIETANAAFDENRGEELAHILEEVAKTIRYDFGNNVVAAYSFPVQDSNGNSVGRAELLSR